MGTCACSEQYFFYNINYDDEASQPRISGKKLISSTISAGGGYDNEGVRTGQDTKAKMIELKQMFDEGLITGAELAAKKAELLKNM
jgi:hypothetical protein